MSRLSLSLRIALPLLGLMASLVASLGCDPAATAEADRAIAEMDALAARACACDETDLMCILDVAEQAERMANSHMFVKGTDAQLAKYEAAGNRAIACVERVTGKL